MVATLMLPPGRAHPPSALAPCAAALPTVLERADGHLPRIRIAPLRKLRARLKRRRFSMDRLTLSVPAYPPTQRAGGALVALRPASYNLRSGAA